MFDYWEALKYVIKEKIANSSWVYVISFVSIIMWKRLSIKYFSQELTR